MYKIPVHGYVTGCVLDPCKILITGVHVIKRVKTLIIIATITTSRNLNCITRTTDNHRRYSIREIT